MAYGIRLIFRSIFSLAGRSHVVELAYLDFGAFVEKGGIPFQARTSTFHESHRPAVNQSQGLVVAA